LTEFTILEKTVLDRIQRDFPLVPDPFAEMARELSISEDEFLSTARSLKERGVIRNIAAIFNIAGLGYISILVAFQVGADDIDLAAGIINSHPGVSHNYLRVHRYNLWFTLASESEGMLAKTLSYLAAKAHAQDHLVFRNEQLLKIGLILDINGDGPSEDELYPAAGGPGKPGKLALTPDEKEALRLLQIDLPLVADPFAHLVDTMGGRISGDLLIDYLQEFSKKGVLRRYSAVLRHVKAGYTANAMTAWKYGKGDDLDRIAAIFFARPAISHLYLRSVHPGKWEYPLFAMIHARSEGELEDIIGNLSRESGLSDYMVLRTLREFKKERPVYFSNKFVEWESRAGI
jgi:DNA-binding Lrp family transcriptional regulator